MNKGFRVAFLLTLLASPGHSEDTLRIWNDPPRFECPFPQSGTFAAVGFTGKVWSGGKADTFYPSWGKDGHLYSCFTDGAVDGVRVSSRAKKDGRSRVAYLTIKGESPTGLEFTDHGILTHRSAPYRGRYPSACLVHDLLLSTPLGRHRARLPSGGTAMNHSIE